MKKLLYLFIVSGILLCACRHTDSTALLRQADAVVYGNADSAMKSLHGGRFFDFTGISLFCRWYGHGKDAEFIRAEIQIFILAEKA